MKSLSCATRTAHRLLIITASRMMATLIAVITAIPLFAPVTANAGAEATTAHIPETPIGRSLRLSVSDDLIADMAATNPDAAHVLFVLDLRGKQEDDIVTANGQGGSTFLATADFVRQALTAARAGAEVPAHEAPLASSVSGVETDMSRVTWALENVSAGAPRLVLAHRIVSESGEDVAQIHPDVVVKLKDVSQPKNGVLVAGARHWSTR